MNQFARMGKTTILGPAVVGGDSLVKNLIAGAAVALALFGAAPSAQAAVITWTLQSVTFNDGGTASGFFDYDTILGTAGNFDITTTGGSVLPAFHYDTSTSVFFPGGGYGPNDLLWIEYNGSRYINLGFAGSLGTAGSMMLTTAGNGGFGGYECDNCVHLRRVTGGSVTGTAVPEPGSWALMLTGFLGAGAALRRTRRQRAALAA